LGGNKNRKPARGAQRREMVRKGGGDIIKYKDIYIYIYRIGFIEMLPCKG
jgi:hypothetical protein